MQVIVLGFAVSACLTACGDPMYSAEQVERQATKYLMVTQVTPNTAAPNFEVNCPHGLDSDGDAVTCDVEGLDGVLNITVREDSNAGLKYQLSVHG